MFELETKASHLNKVFQGAIVELSAKLKKDKKVLSPDDVQKTEYVVAMATVNSLNLELVVRKGPFYYEANKTKVDRLFAEATNFAEALCSEGFGSPM